MLPNGVLMPKRKRTAAQLIVSVLPGILGLGLVAFGLLTMASIHAGGHNPNSRSGLGFIVVGVVLIMVWAFSNKSDGYNF